MKNLRQLCMALVLTLTLSAVAHAGQVDCPGITQEPPTEEATAAGDIQNGVQSTNADAMTQTTLTLILIALSVV